MVKGTFGTVLVGVLALSLPGCAQNAIKGRAGRHEQIYRGTLGITGNDHQVVLLTGSDVPKLSILGRDNRVIVSDGAAVAKIEIVGRDNEVSYPQGMEFAVSAIGRNNKLIQRP